MIYHVDIYRSIPEYSTLGKGGFVASIEQKFGRLVRRLRERRGYTQEEFADLVETERSYYSGIERGRHSLTLTKIATIIKVLDMRWSSFFKYMDED